MRTKQHVRGARRETMVQKDSLESSLYFEDSMPVRKGKLTKIRTQGMGDATSPKNVMDSPDSIYTPLAAGPPAMKSLPEPVIGQEPSSQALPGTAMWGGGRRVWTSPREKEVLDLWLDHVKLESRAKLPIKTKSTHSDMDRSEKVKQRGLTQKYWGKQRAQKKVARLDADELAVVLKMADAGIDEHKQQVFVANNSHFRRDGTMRGRPRKNSALRAKIRRFERCAARDRKCFAFDDPENLPVRRTQPSRLPTRCFPTGSPSPLWRRWRSGRRR